jgi:hypothetical protein
MRAADSQRASLEGQLSERAAAAPDESLQSAVHDGGAHLLVRKRTRTRAGRTNPSWARALPGHGAATHVLSFALVVRCSCGTRWLRGSCARCKTSQIGTDRPT